ncbi:porin family protein [Xylanibacter ruminicola]|uniref:Probable protein-translocating porin PorT n=1 Tax=Xylanibacter ruminicola TaxID=839 RepID=A0A1M6WYW7_XYLRU|nr:porin family protein [Xylanibacter ruminicola]SHK98755.1 probable protein-translocating porin PorT [Xylanibacter ruminicola]
MRRKLVTIIAAITIATGCLAQRRNVIQHKPYIDLRPMHFGISVGMNLQDIEFKTDPPIVCDEDRWNAGFSVGVLADMRLSSNLNLRITPSMHFGAKHLRLLNLADLDAEGKPKSEIQDMKNTYLAVPVDLKFSSQRWNNIRPYILAGVSPMINLTNKNQEIIQLNRTDLMVEVGLGCDLYLPFFKLIPELKFCYGLGNRIDKSHVADLKDENKKMYANSIKSGHTKMIVLTFYFE